MSGAAWTDAREHGASWLVRLIIWITLNLGWRVGHALLYPITAYFYVTLPEARAASRLYLGRVLSRKATVADVWQHFFTYACVILDRICFLGNRTRRFRIRESGLEVLTAALAEGRGCVLLGAHLGSFEALRALARRSPVPVRALMYRGTTGPLSTFMEALDPAVRESVIEIGPPAAMLRVRECIERGEIVGILADRAPGTQRRAAASFLGTTAMFPTGPLHIAATLGAPVLLFFGLRTGRRSYRIVLESFTERIAFSTEPREAVLARWAVRYAARLEAHCRAHPFNWFNFYDFWETGRDDAQEANAGRRGGPARLPGSRAVVASVADR